MCALLSNCVFYLCAKCVNWAPYLVIVFFIALMRKCLARCLVIGCKCAKHVFLFSLRAPIGAKVEYYSAKCAKNRVCCICMSVSVQSTLSVKFVIVVTYSNNKRKKSFNCFLFALFMYC